MVKGLVESVKSIQGQYGPMFTIYVNGQGYGTGKTSQGVNQGDFVEFSATQKPGTQYWNVDKGTLKPADRPKSLSQPVGNTTPAPYVDTRQESIVFQSSRKDAIEYLNILMVGGMIDFGKAKGADKIAVAEAHLDKITEHFVAEAVARKTFQSQDESTEVEETSYVPKTRPAKTTVASDDDFLGE